MLERILGIILPVFSIIILGWAYARRVKPDMTFVNRISMNVAEQFRQEPGKVASIVLIGNLLSIIFVPLGLTLACGTEPR